MMFIGLFWLVAILLLARWIFFPDPARALPPDYTRRTDAELARLREEVERLAGEVDRLQDEQGFLLRLLEQGESPPRLPAGEDAPPRAPDA